MKISILILRKRKNLKKLLNKYISLFYQKAVIMPNLKDSITNFFKKTSFRNQISKLMHFNYKIAALMTYCLTNLNIPKKLEISY